MRQAAECGGGRVDGGAAKQGGEKQVARETRGLLYVAIGRRYLAEAVRSASSAQRCMPNIPAVVFTDLPDQARDHFDRVETVTQQDRHPFLTRIAALTRSPFDRTLHLDTDTWVCRSCEDVFDLLDRFQMAAAHAVIRCRTPVPQCPPAFPELNGGVIAYRNDPAVPAVLTRWYDLFAAQLDADPLATNDQAALRRAIYESSVRLAVLPPEYNCRTLMPGLVGGASDCKVIHDGYGNLRRIAALLNRSRRPRVFLPHLGLLQPSTVCVLTPGRVVFDALTRPLGVAARLIRRRRGRRRREHHQTRF